METREQVEERQAAITARAGLIQREVWEEREYAMKRVNQLSWYNDNKAALTAASRRLDWLNRLYALVSQDDVAFLMATLQLYPGAAVTVHHDDGGKRRDCTLTTWTATDDPSRVTAYILSKPL